MGAILPTSTPISTLVLWQGLPNAVQPVHTPGEMTQMGVVEPGRTGGRRIFCVAPCDVVGQRAELFPLPVLVQEARHVVVGPAPLIGGRETLPPQAITQPTSHRGRIGDNGRRFADFGGGVGDLLSTRLLLATALMGANLGGGCGRRPQLDQIFALTRSETDAVVHTWCSERVHDVTYSHLRQLLLLSTKVFVATEVGLPTSSRFSGGISHTTRQSNQSVHLGGQPPQSA